jgi:multisubunit Na+/H+ antiporter MnhF subunit
LINQAHVIVSVGSSIVFMLILLITLVLYAYKSKHRVLFLSLCGAFAAMLLMGFYVLWTSALYQFSAVLSFMLILLGVNTVSVRRFLKKNECKLTDYGKKKSKTIRL